MPADNKKMQLRARLAGKSTRELEELLVLGAEEAEADRLDADYIATILEVIAERESDEEKEINRQKTEQAREEFREYYTLRKEEALETGINGNNNPPDHHRKTEYGQKTRKSPRTLRRIVVIAAAVSLLGSTAMGWNIFQAIAHWGEETFGFRTGQEVAVELPQTDVFRALRALVEEESSLFSVPQRAPNGTVESEMPKVTTRTNRSIFLGMYAVEEREFTVRIIVHDTIPEAYTINYQKDMSLKEDYTAGGIEHHITENNGQLSVIWTNNRVEGHIQGKLTIEELRQIIDSIYEENIT